MSEIAGQTGHRGAATGVVNESYSFACMRCGHGWEQSYAIEHHTDGDGNEFVLYVADGRVVPSPLSRPSCQNCDGHVVRIMRAGQVSSVQHQLHRHDRPAGPVVDPASKSPSGEAAAARKQRDHHWHLSDLLHPFQRKAG
ncbi:hypothetical protein ABZV31_23145 [Streptomyces sp. NPDC005202]|uniref:hypothetical protein n=1 Tax=Streptomyces sp. NPDC005202 TaxID=3157021 RepID=UPI0033AA1F02